MTIVHSKRIVKITANGFYAEPAAIPIFGIESHKTAIFPKTHASKFVQIYYFSIFVLNTRTQQFVFWWNRKCILCLGCLNVQGCLSVEECAKTISEESTDTKILRRQNKKSHKSHRVAKITENSISFLFWFPSSLSLTLPISFDWFAYDSSIFQCSNLNILHFAEMLKEFSISFQYSALQIRIKYNQYVNRIFSVFMVNEKKHFTIYYRRAIQHKW